MVPLIRLTASRALMSGYANLRSVTLLASVAAAAIIACNVWLVMWAIDNAHGFGTLIVVATLAVAALASLVHIAIVPLRTSAAIGYTSVDAPPPGGRSRQSQPL